jgi:N-acetylglucosaminyldiphosphoundecaprenol N-acetyl-beta-D-mannosaminyltransferase
MGFNVYNAALSEIALVDGTTKILNTISPNSYGISRKDTVFRTALQSSDFLVLDGVYFALASIILKGKTIRPNQGPDVFGHFMDRMNRTRGRVFFFGSTSETLTKMKLRAQIDYPNVDISSYAPPFRSEFTEEDNRESVERIANFKPDIVFVGLTCPKQEKWSYQNKQRIKAKLVCSVGAVFDWYSGNQKEIHPLWWKYRLAWLKRTIDRPEILKRYPNIGIFFRDVILQLLRIRHTD